VNTPRLPRSMSLERKTGKGGFVYLDILEGNDDVKSI
jgi:hypothetical protein